MNRLIVMRKNFPLRQVSLASGNMLIGRDLDSDLFIDHPEISRQHAEMVVVANVVLVHDLGSTNGTFVNGRKVQTQALCHNDVVRVGDTDIRYLRREPSVVASDFMGLS